MGNRMPVEHHGTFNGTDLCWFEWGEPKAGETSLLLAHATGFHARCWDQVLLQLDQHAVAVELRGHGRSSNDGPFDWHLFGDDLADFVGQVMAEGALAIGHSMGGHAIMQAALARPQYFSQLLLIDPVIMSPDIYSAAEHEHSQWVDESGLHPVARRRNYFESVDQMIENFLSKGSYALWQAEVLRDYCEWGSVPAEDGVGLQLACPPSVEASVYMGSSKASLIDRLSELTIPVRIMRARQREGERGTMDFSASPTWPELASRLPMGTDQYLPELTHFIPMQAPDLVADTITELLVG